MLKFTSISDWDFRVITDITLTVTIIRTGVTTDLITARTTGTVGHRYYRHRHPDYYGR